MQVDFPLLSSLAMASLAFTAGRRPSIGLDNLFVTCLDRNLENLSLGDAALRAAVFASHFDAHRHLSLLYKQPLITIEAERDLRTGHSALFYSSAVIIIPIMCLVKFLKCKV
ncbi:hypothetical protein RB195_024511 [Necator americanus]|uniref:Uncharacterized protein n=1 Tax=Necator americanus TaxID=51031 RepID=A0ABR1ENH8_NECAM